MPIKSENKERYPENWPEIVQRIRKRSGGCCEKCGIKNHIIIRRLPGDKYRTPGNQEWDMIHSRIRNQHSTMTESLKHFGFVKVILTVAHLDHTPENCEDSNLRDLCQKCHNNYDKKHRRQTRIHARNQGNLLIGFD
jgi:5-methylcytosine-specific restriction endonuclease McrA